MDKASNFQTTKGHLNLFLLFFKIINYKIYNIFSNKRLNQHFSIKSWTNIFLKSCTNIYLEKNNWFNIFKTFSSTFSWRCWWHFVKYSNILRKKFQHFYFASLSSPRPPAHGSAACWLVGPRLQRRPTRAHAWVRGASALGRSCGGCSSTPDRRRAGLVSPR